MNLTEELQKSQDLPTGGGENRFNIVKSAVRYYGMVLPLKLVCLVSGFVIFGILNMLRRWVKIRVGRLNNNRIGALAVNTELYLRRRSWEKNDKRDLHIFLTGYPTNRQLLTMIKRRLMVIESPPLVRLYDTVQARTKTSDLWIKLASNSNEYDEFNNIRPQLVFTEEEEEKGEQLLIDMGIKPGTPFVCFHSRDKAYLDKLHSYRSRDEWSYHDYRNCDVDNYLPAAQYIASLGLYAIRMGYVVEKILGTIDARVIDYAVNYRSDFGDIYLSAKCKFFLGSEGGLICIPWVFNVPVAYCNGAPPGAAAAWRKTDVFIPKKLWSCEKKRFLTFREIVAGGMDRFFYTQMYEQAGVQVVENSPNEILAVVKELNERLDGTWMTTDEDEELQQRYRAIFQPGTRVYGFPSRVGAEFLRQNRELLD